MRHRQLRRKRSQLSHFDLTPRRSQVLRIPGRYLDYTDANTTNRERLEMTFPLTGKNFELKKEKREQQRSIRNLKIAIYHLNAVKKRERDQVTARGIDDAIDALKATIDGAHNRIDALNQELETP